MPDERVSITIRARDLASRVMGGVGRTLSRVRRAVFSVQSAVVALGAVGIARIGKSLLDAFVGQQDAVEGLRASLIATGKDGAESLEFLTAQAAELQKVTRAGDEAIIAATASLAQLAPALDTRALGQAQRALVGLADQFFKGDLESAALQLGKAIGSSTNSLSRYGIQVDTSASANERLQQILRQTDRFFQTSQARALTFGGRLAQLSNAWGDLHEAMGRFIAESPIASAFIDDMKGAIEQVTAILGGEVEDVRQAFELAGRISGTAFKLAFLRSIQALPDLIREASARSFPFRFLPRGVFDFLSAPTTALNRGLTSLVAPTEAIANATAQIREDLEAIERLSQNVQPPAPPAPPRTGQSGNAFDFGSITIPTPDFTQPLPGRQPIAPLPSSIEEFFSPERMREWAAAMFPVTTGIDRLIELERFAADVKRDTATATERFNERLRDLDEALRAGTLTHEEYERAVEQANQTLEESAEEQRRAAQAAKDAAAGAVLAWSAAAADFIRSVRGGSFFDIVGAAGGIVSLVPGGQIFGAGLLGAGLVGDALFSSNGRSVPVTIDDISDRAARKQRRSQGDERPQEIRVTIVNERGETTDELRYRLNRRGALQGVLIPNRR